MSKIKGFKIKYYINYIIVVAVLAVVLGLWLNGGLGLSAARIISQMAYSVILAVSLNLVVGFLGELSLGHAGFMCVGAYLGGYVANVLYGSMESKLMVVIIAMVIGGLAAAVMGVVIGIPALRLKGDYLAIVTLAFGEIIRNIFKNIPLFGGAKGLVTTKHLVRSDLSLVIVALVVVLIMLILIQNLARSKHGRAITAIRDNEIAAKAMGINVTFYKIFVFVISAFFAGIAGVFYSQMETPVLYSFFSYNYSIEILVMVVLGGMGSITGSMVAAVLITYINFILQTNLPGELAAIKYLIYALILILIVVFKNAPGLKDVRERLELSAIKNRVVVFFAKKKSKSEVVKDDEASWERIPTKINMNEVLSVDIQSNDSEKEDK